MTQCCLIKIRKIIFLQIYSDVCVNDIIFFLSSSTTTHDVMMTRRLTTIATITKQAANEAMATTTAMTASKAKTATATVLTCFLVEEGSRQVTTQIQNLTTIDSFFFFLDLWLVAGSTENFIPLPKTREIAGHKPRRVKLSRTTFSLLL